MEKVFIEGDCNGVYWRNKSIGKLKKWLSDDYLFHGDFNIYCSSYDKDKISFDQLWREIFGFQDPFQFPKKKTNKTIIDLLISWKIPFNVFWVEGKHLNLPVHTSEKHKLELSLDATIPEVIFQEFINAGVSRRYTKRCFNLIKNIFDEHHCL